MARRRLIWALLIAALVVTGGREGSAGPYARGESARAVRTERAAKRTGPGSWRRIRKGARLRSLRSLDGTRGLGVRLRGARLRGARLLGARSGRSEVLRLPRGMQFEGGDLLPLPRPRPEVSRAATPLEHGVVLRTVEDARRYNIQAGTEAPIYFLGHGFRTSEGAAQKMADQLGAIVVAGQLTDPRFFHADTALGILPDGVTLYRDGFSAQTNKLLHYLYPGRVQEVNPVEAEKLATNGRLIRLGGSEQHGRAGEHFAYFYTEGAFAPGFFEKLTRKYPGGKITSREVSAGGTRFVEHELRYRQDGVDKRVTFVPMPTTQAVLGAGSVSCVTLLGPDGKTVIMVPPDHFELSLGHNPAEDANAANGVDKRLAMKEYVQQKARFERYGVQVEVVAPDANLHEQIYTRDTGYFFNRDASGRAWDPVLGSSKGAPVFLSGAFNHPARRGEVGAIRQALSL